jgi:[ribosomal protein S5]-alanine N-acetyltransferase
LIEKDTMKIETQRLWLVPNTLEIIKTRLEQRDFKLEVAGIGEVHFPPEFPGDAFALYPMRLESINSGQGLSVGGIVIERPSLTAIGELGCKGDPDPTGAVEIGYGLNPSVWNRGYATEIVGAFTAWLLEQPGITTVTAETATSNPASARVLEKCGFVRTGTSWNEDDGSLILWQLT